MSREIKFRCWDRVDNKMHLPDDFGYQIKTPAADFFDADVYWMQLTGLKDKHGNPIYEGDIVLVFEEDWDEDEGAHSYVVEWGNEYPAFTLKGYEDIEYNSLQHAALVVKCEVIGNIYQHPELIQNQNA